MLSFPNPSISFFSSQLRIPNPKMDREPEELQFLSLIGIYRESSTLLLRSRRLFGQIAASLVLPLSLLFLAHVHISHYLFSQINKNESLLETSVPDSQSQSKILSRLASEWAAFLLFKAAYLLFLLVFSLLSTSAVVYAVASVFTSKEVDFQKVLFTVVPRVWRRLMVTFLWAFLLVFAYNLSAAAVAVAVILITGQNGVGVAVATVMLVLYVSGLVWIGLIWHVASVVSVLEDDQGIEAMKKSRRLIKGKTWTAAAIFLKLNFVFLAIEFGFREMVVVKGSSGAGMRMFYGLVFLGAICAVVLFGLVVQTVVYFVCKSYHHESIDRSSLADHLDVYLGDYEPLKGRDVQLELERYYS